MYTGVCISDTESRYKTPEWKRAYMYVSRSLHELYFLINKSCRDYCGLKKKISAIRQERASAERTSLRGTPARVFNQLRSRSRTISTFTTTPAANQNQADAQPLQATSASMEGTTQQARSPLTFSTPSTTEGILNKTPGSGAVHGRVYGTFLRTPPREPHLESTNPPDVRLPPPIQSVPEQPEPEDRAPNRGDLRSRSSFALPPPALPAVQKAVSYPTHSLLCVSDSVIARR
jgi:hypothetical protein